MGRVRHGIVILPDRPWREQSALWKRAEDYGFDHAWTYDHLSWRSLANGPWGATVPLLTAAAMVTERIRLGTFVASPNYRHPVPFAKDLASIDEISNGRFILGLGSGGTGFDAFVLGQPELSPAERHARFEEFTRFLDTLLRFEEPGGSGIALDGRWYQAVGARMVGAPNQSPRLPLALAANGPKGMRLVAELGDAWVTTVGDVDDQASWWRRAGDLSARFDDILAASGREAGDIDRILSLDGGPEFSLSSAANYEDAAARAAELNFTDVVAHWPRASGVYTGDESVLDEVAASFSRA
jgi:alkanesulfonate monooxygenase SsuD/methylene tetrahydromethanopterin reductase-like flavin-dependent oxidoreductase (luciferase family)